MASGLDMNACNYCLPTVRWSARIVSGYGFVNDDDGAEAAATLRGWQRHQIEIRKRERERERSERGDLSPNIDEATFVFLCDVAPPHVQV